MSIKSMRIMRINQLKGIYFPKVEEVVELISCQTNYAIPLMSVPKGVTRIFNQFV